MNIYTDQGGYPVSAPGQIDFSGNDFTDRFITKPSPSFPINPNIYRDDNIFLPTPKPSTNLPISTIPISTVPLIQTTPTFSLNPLDWFSGIFGSTSNITKWILPIAIIWLLPKLLAKIPFIRRFKRWIPIIIALWLMQSGDSQTKNFMNSQSGVLALASPSIAKLMFPLAGLTGAIPMVTAALATAGLAFSTARKYRSWRRSRRPILIRRNNYRITRRY